MGLFLLIPGAIVISHCNWNPVEGSVVPDGFCRDYVALYFPLLSLDYIIYIIYPAFFPLFLFFRLLSKVFLFESDYAFMISFRIIFVIFGSFVLAFISLFCGWIIIKIKKLFLKMIQKYE